MEDGWTEVRYGRRRNRRPNGDWGGEWRRGKDRAFSSSGWRRELSPHPNPNWTEAQSYCRDKFTDLATIQNQDDWTTVKEMLPNSTYSFAWLGLYDDVKSWRWSLDNTSLYHTDLGSWFNFTEDNSDGDEHCADIWNGQVNDRSCQSKVHSVCYHETTGSYITVTDLMSWQWAQSYCREHYTDLASITDQQELNAVLNVTQTNVTYWVGLSREGWKWSDQSHSSFRRWGPRQPNKHGGDCGAARVEGWFARACGRAYPFICSVPVRHSVVLRVALESNGSVNIDDPAVQEAILEQMEERLRAQGVTQPLSLSWRKQPNGQVCFNKTDH